MKNQSKKSAANGAAPAVNISAPAGTDEAAYQAAVENGRAIVADMSGKQWLLGDLATEVKTAYGENRLEQFALDINCVASTLSRYRSVCLAFPKTGGRPRFFAAAQILAIHPDRVAIVERTPDISKAAARALMHGKQAAEVDEADDDVEETDDDTEATATRAKAKGNKAKATPKEEWGKDLDSILSDVLAIANAASRIKNSISQATPERQAAVRKKMASPEWQEAIDPGCDALSWIRDFANGLLEAEADTLLQQESRVVRTPPHASASTQPGA